MRVAVKGESASVAHGLKRWQQLAEEYGKTGRFAPAVSQICRLALTRRPPLGSERYLQSVGFHLVGRATPRPI